MDDVKEAEGLEEKMGFDDLKRIAQKELLSDELCTWKVFLTKLSNVSDSILKHIKRNKSLFTFVSTVLCGLLSIFCMEIVPFLTRAYLARTGNDKIYPEARKIIEDSIDAVGISGLIAATVFLILWALLYFFVSTRFRERKDYRARQEPKGAVGRIWMVINHIVLVLGVMSCTAVHQNIPVMLIGMPFANAMSYFHCWTLWYKPAENEKNVPLRFARLCFGNNKVVLSTVVVFVVSTFLEGLFSLFSSEETTSVLIILFQLFYMVIGVLWYALFGIGLTGLVISDWQSERSKYSQENSDKPVSRPVWSHSFRAAMFLLVFVVVEFVLFCFAYYSFMGIWVPAVSLIIGS